ncbi:ABC transporter permease [Sciscionella sediminilitoris]|uniref:ABC transporter permease n=1 Tax=Sciscionella sediminilitoris TaxID=1445613 RepID=UPI0004DFA1F4|nr:ABC transporter permease [Sciscionella sp. SE31]
MLYALAATELRVLWRNRTALFTAVLLPLALGIFWLYTFPRHTPSQWATVIALQLAVVAGMSLYLTATSTVVARRHNLVLKRLRTSELSDPELFTGLLAPSVATTLAQLIVLGIVDTIAGAPAPADPGALALAVLAGLSLAATAALATTLITPSPERANITGLPLVFVLVIGAILLTLNTTGGLPHILMAVPGTTIGRLTALAYRGDIWAIGIDGIPAALPAVAALIFWPVVFASLVRKRFRWDNRN